MSKVLTNQRDYVLRTGSSSSESVSLGTVLIGNVDW